MLTRMRRGSGIGKNARWERTSFNWSAAFLECRFMHGTLQDTRAQQSNTSMFTYIEKTIEKQSKKKPVKNYYCMSDISCLLHGDRLKATVVFLRNIYS